jgi:hypothetical protein
MNIALTLSQDNKAMLIYDQPLSFIPAWIESSEDGRGLRIIGEDGQEFTAGVLYENIIAKLQNLTEIKLVRMQDRKPVESHKVSFVNQNYKEGVKA